MTLRTIISTRVQFGRMYYRPVRASLKAAGMTMRSEHHNRSSADYEQFGDSNLPPTDTSLTSLLPAQDNVRLFSHR